MTVVGIIVVHYFINNQMAIEKRLIWDKVDAWIISVLLFFFFPLESISFKRFVISSELSEL